jgi:hypothetical protein
MVESLDALIAEVSAAHDERSSARVLVTGLADRLAGVTHPAEAIALADALSACTDALVEAIAATPPVF